jgi:hypothetical protein
MARTPASFSVVEFVYPVSDRFIRNSRYRSLLKKAFKKQLLPVCKYAPMRVSVLSSIISNFRPGNWHHLPHVENQYPGPHILGALVEMKNIQWKPPVHI